MRGSIRRIELYLRALTLLAFQQAQREEVREDSAGTGRVAESDPNTAELRRLYSAIVKAND